MAELEASRGPRSWLVDGLTRLFGDNKTAAEYANKVADLYDLTGAGAVTTGAYDAGNALAKAAQDPSKQKLMAAGLTAASMLPFSNALGKAAGMAAKDAGRTTHIFAGPQALHADKNALARSEVALIQGAHPDTVWQETGWNPNIANQAVWEINDQPAKYFPPNMRQGFLPIQSVLEHPELYANYPQFKDLKVAITPHLNGALAEFNEKAGVIRLATKVAENPEMARSVILHELQHAVQSMEGFPRGGNERHMAALYSEQNPQIMANASDINTDSPHAIAREQYMRLAGETEARNVQSRRDYDEAQRRHTAPYWTEDRKREHQIILDGEYVPLPTPPRGY